MADDLMLTNQYNTSNKIKKDHFDTQSKPHNLNELSYGIQQYEELLKNKTSKLYNKTILNIDSSNRQLNYNVTKTKLNIIDNFNLITSKNSNYFYIITEEYIYKRDKKNIIISSVKDDILRAFNISNIELFEFNIKTGKPILNIISFHYNKNINFSNYIEIIQNIDSYQVPHGNTYNIIKIDLPGVIDKQLVKSNIIHSDVVIHFINNINTSYSNPSHYKISLGRDFSKIKSIRLLSTEIPNTGFLFNNNRLRTDEFSESKYTDSINNKIEWINELDKINEPNFSVNILSNVNNTYFSSDLLEANSIQKEQNEINKLSFNINKHEIVVQLSANININLLYNTEINFNNNGMATDGFIFNTSAYKDQDSIYFLSYYNELFSNLYSTFTISDDNMNLYKIDNNILIDGINNNAINDENYLLLSQQNNKQENNIYIYTKNKIAKILFSSGANYIKEDLKKIRLFKYTSSLINTELIERYTLFEYSDPNKLNITISNGDIFNNGDDIELTNLGNIKTIKLNNSLKKIPLNNIKTPLNKTRINTVSDLRTNIINTYQPLANGIYLNMVIEANNISLTTSMDIIVESGLIKSILINQVGNGLFDSGDIIDIRLPTDNNTQEVINIQLSFEHLISPYKINFKAEGSINSNKDLLLHSIQNISLKVSNITDIPGGLYSKCKLYHENPEKESSFNTHAYIDVGITYSASGNSLEVIYMACFLDETRGLLEIGDNYNTTDIYKLDIKSISSDDVLATITLQFKKETLNITRGKNAEFYILLSNSLESLVNNTNESNNIVNSSFVNIYYLNEYYNYIYKCIQGNYNKNSYYLIKKSITYYTFIKINYDKRVQFLNTFIKCDKIINEDYKSKRDYYYDFDLIGKFNQYGISTLQNKYLTNSVSFLHKNLITDIENKFKFFYKIFGYTSNFEDTRNCFVFNFKDNFQLQLNYLESTKGYINIYLLDEILSKLILPIKVTFISLDGVVLYNYYIVKYTRELVNQVGNRIKVRYNFDLIPTYGSFDINYKNAPFINSKTCIMILHKAISNKELISFQNKSPDIYSTLKNKFLYNDISPHIYNINSSKEYSEFNNAKINIESYTTNYNSNSSTGQTEEQDKLYIFTYSIVDYDSNLSKICILYKPNNEIYIPDETLLVNYNSSSPNNTIKIPIKYIDFKDFTHISKHFDILNITTVSDDGLLDTNNFKYIYYFTIIDTSYDKDYYIFTFDNHNSSSDEFRKSIINYKYNMVSFSKKNVENITKLIYISSKTSEDNREKTIQRMTYTSNNVLDFSLQNKYVEFFLIKLVDKYKIINPSHQFNKNVTIYSVVYKTSINLPLILYSSLNNNTSMLSNNIVYVSSYYIHNTIYCKLSANILINPLIDNKAADSNESDVQNFLNTINYNIQTNEYNMNEYGAYLLYYDNNIDINTDNFLLEFIDIIEYSQLILSLNTLPKFIPTQKNPINKEFDLIPNYNKTSHYIPKSLNINSETIIHSRLFINEIYPKYQWEIDPGNYNENNFKKNFEIQMNNNKSFEYDFNKKEFIPIKKNPRVFADNLFKNQFQIEFNKNNKTLIINQYQNIYKGTRSKFKNVFYNKGFPYIFFKIFDLNLINNQIVNIEGLPNIENIKKQGLNGKHNVIICNNYSIKIRQLNNINKDLVSNLLNKNTNSIDLDYKTTKYKGYIKTNNQFYVKPDFINQLKTSFINDNGKNEFRSNEYNNEYILQYISTLLNNDIDTYTETFQNNELFVKLSDVLVNDNYSITGRITNLDGIDKNNNISLQYDLFQNNIQNFNVGDIIIGLDSGAIGFILPEEYDFYKLPDNELILLGMGYYIINKYDSISSHFLSFYNSVSNTETNTNDNIVEFIENFTKWNIKKNTTSNGFYIKVNCVNVSNLSGSNYNKLNIYISHKFKFLYGYGSGLNVLGLIKTRYTDIFNTYKNNYTLNFTAYIRNSYIFNPGDYNSKIIFEIVDINELSIGDHIFIENHRIVTDKLNFNKTIALKNKSFTSYSKFLNDFNVLYNASIISNPLINTHTYFSDDISQINWSISYIKPIPDEGISDENKCKVVYYTDNYGKIINIYIISNEDKIGGGKGYIYTENREIFNVSKNFKFSIEINVADKSVKNIKNITTNNTLNVYQKIIPFKNNYYGIELNQDYINYNTHKYTLIFKSLLEKYEKNVFSIENTGNLIKKIVIYKLDENNKKFKHNIIDDISENDKKKGNFRLDIIDLEGNIYSGILRSIYSNSKQNGWVFINTGGNFNLINNKQYTIQLIHNRNIVAFNNILKDNTDNSLIIKNNMYETMSIWYRLNYSYLNKKLTMDNIFNKLDNDSRYNIEDYFNRIIKIKVAPVDNKGFSNENSSTSYNYRDVHNYTKKLFPYHMMDNKRLKRVQNTKGDLNFKKGMGIYVIQDEIMNNKFVGEEGNFIGYSHYKYNTKFIGYVLNTSLVNDEKVLINSENFSENDQEIYTEYFIYLLIDPFIKTKMQIKELFDLLNKDNINIIYDGSYNINYTNDIPLINPGILENNEKYIYKSSPGDDNYLLDVSKSLITGNTKIDNETIYKTNVKYNNDSGTLKTEIYKDRFAQTIDYTINPDVNNPNIDILQNYLYACIIIEKSKLNKTIKNYEYTNLACATITQRCVFKSEDNHEFFSYGNLELFYNEQYKNKVVLEYEPLLDKTNKQFFHEHNINIKNSPLYYNKKNKYEFEFHQNKNFTDSNGIDFIEGIKPTVIFDNNTTIMLNLESNGESLNKNVKIIENKIIPKISFDNFLSFDNLFNKFFDNKIIIEQEYNQLIKNIGLNPSMSKIKLNNYDIVGNNSEIYEADINNSYCVIENVIELNNYIDTNNSSKRGYMITSYKIALLDVDNNNKFVIPNIYNNNSLVPIETDTSGKSIPIFKNMLVILNSSFKNKHGIIPDNNISNVQFGIIEEALVYNSQEIFTINSETKQFNEKTILFKFKNKIVGANLENNGQYYLYNPIFNTSKDIVYNNETDTFNIYLDDIYNNTIHYDYLRVNDLIAIDYGNKRNIEMTEEFNPPFIINNNFKTISTTYFTKIKNIFKKDTHTILEIDFSPIIYNKNTKIVLFKNILLNNTFINSKLNDPILYNTLSTQPFVHNSEWYTNVFFRNPTTNKGVYRTNTGKYNTIFNNLVDTDFNDTFFNTIYPEEFFINNMKGISIPFSDLNLNSDNMLEFKESSQFINPISDNSYENVINISESFSKNKYLSNQKTIKGDFINVNNKFQWIYNEKNTNYNYITIKGIYMGFGGIINNNYNKETINELINTEKGFLIEQIQSIDNKKFIFIKNENQNMDVDIENENELQLSYNDFLELSLVNRDNINKNHSLISLYGEGGEIVKKKINKIYNFDLDNYIYLIIPNLNHIETVQNNIIDSAFTKILMPASSDNVLYNTFINSEKVYTENLFNNLNELEVAFVTDSGRLFDFNKIDHSFTLEITEIIERLEYINPQFNKIEEVENF